MLYITLATANGYDQEEPSHRLTEHSIMQSLPDIIL